MINKAMLLGNVGKDAEVKSFSNGGQVMQFSLATNRSYKDKNGEWQTITQWHNIKTNDERTIEYMTPKIKKGVKLYVEGEIEYRKWETEEGVKHFTDIVVPRFSGVIKVIEKGETPEEVAQAAVNPYGQQPNPNAPKQEFKDSDIPW